MVPECCLVMNLKQVRRLQEAKQNLAVLSVEGTWQAGMQYIHFFKNYMCMEQGNMHFPLQTWLNFLCWNVKKEAKSLVEMFHILYISHKQFLRNYKETAIWCHCRPKRSKCVYSIYKYLLKKKRTSRLNATVAILWFARCKSHIFCFHCLHDIM